ncbi:MAG: OBG GTPase family GTP-binding protein [Candidatus Bilamarchaeaceae archaeon]
MGIQERIRELEEEVKKTKYNKATQHHIGRIKARIAQLKMEMISPSRTKAGKKTGGFDVRRTGDATVALIGLPSVGKSTILNRITNAESKAAAYAFTTLKCIPGVMDYGGTKIQVLDLPGIIEGAKDGKGRGREVIGVARGADMVLIVLDHVNPEKQYELILRELMGFGIRLNMRPPNIRVSKTFQGGIDIHSAMKLTKLTHETIVAVLNEYGIFSANVIVRGDYDVDDLIDTLEGNRVYLPAVVAINKIDLARGLVGKRMPFDFVPISAEKNENVELLKKKVFENLHIIKIYTKRRGEEADMTEPMVMRAYASVEDVCRKLHRDLVNEFRYAVVWGKSVKHPPQRVGLYHMLEDGDIVEITKR